MPLAAPRANLSVYYATRLRTFKTKATNRATERIINKTEKISDAWAEQKLQIYS